MHRLILLCPTYKKITDFLKLNPSHGWPFVGAMGYRVGRTRNVERGQGSGVDRQAWTPCNSARTPG